MTVQEWLKDITYDENLIAGVVEMNHGTQPIFDVRGWGWLSTHGKMDNETAIKFQDDVGRFIVEATQEKLAKESGIDYKAKYEKAIKIIRRFDAGIIGMYDL